MKNRHILKADEINSQIPKKTSGRETARSSWNRSYDKTAHMNY